jgi:hypothetical protein
MPPCDECPETATICWLRDATAEETTAHQAANAHLPEDCPALVDPLRVPVYRCCAHHGDVGPCEACKSAVPA